MPIPVMPIPLFRRPERSVLAAAGVAAAFLMAVLLMSRTE